MTEIVNREEHDVMDPQARETSPALTEDAVMHFRELVQGFMRNVKPFYESAVETVQKNLDHEAHIKRLDETIYDLRSLLNAEREQRRLTEEELRKAKLERDRLQKENHSVLSGLELIHGATGSLKERGLRGRPPEPRGEAEK